MVNIPRRTRGVKVLKAVSSPLRLQILNLVFDNSGLSYTELMNSLKMNPSRDAGRFAYHLKFLLKADLLEADAETKKYILTDLGKMVLDIADRVEKKADKSRGMLVRTSHFTLEEFDPNKIANSLIKEAKVPPELAKKASREAEKRLRKSKTKYLTAPLIREIVNSILIEKGFEDYRHKLTRLGMPVYEVATLTESKNFQDSKTILSKAGESVLSEYVLLNIFPRDIADAHVSGTLHVRNLGTWILRPAEVIHDLRFFIKYGLRGNKIIQTTPKPPINFENALSLIFNLILQTNKETDDTQVCPYFNIFLAPFIEIDNRKATKEKLRQFILNLSQNSEVALELELSIPTFLSKKEAVGPQGKEYGKYEDFAEESLLLTSLILEICTEESILKPMFNPKIIIKISNNSFENEGTKAILLNTHKIATDKGIVYFAIGNRKREKSTVFSSSGCKFKSELTGDWETDILRTGCLGIVTINLPRIVNESKKDKNKFFEILKERFEMAARALRIKYRSLKRNARVRLPFITQSSNGDTYFRIEYCSRIINLAGFNEAVEAFCNKKLHNEESIKFAEEIAENLLAFRRKLSRRYGKRLFPAILPYQEASKRLVLMDIEKYGIAKVNYSGTRENPFFSTARRLVIQKGDFPTISFESLNVEKKLEGLKIGGNLSIIELGEDLYKAEQLMKLTEHLARNQYLDFFTYNRITTSCENCRKSWYGELHKCPSCGSLSTLTIFNRFQST